METYNTDCSHGGLGGCMYCTSEVPEIDYTKYPMLDPKSPWNIAHSRKGYTVYENPSVKIPGGFKYTITFDGSYLNIASSMRGVRRIIKKHRKQRADDKPAYYECPVIHTEPS